MHRILLEIPIPFLSSPLRIYTYGFMMMVGFALATVLACRRARARSLRGEDMLDLAILLIVAGVLGARLSFVVTDYWMKGRSVDSVADYFAIWEGGLTFQGGLILATVAAYLFLRWKRIPFPLAADIFAPALALGVACGRIGCFLNGCCWGRLCAPEFPLGVRFPMDPDNPLVQHNVNYFYLGNEEALRQAATAAGVPFEYAQAQLLANEGVFVHPAQLYAALSLLAIFGLLLWIERRFRLFSGALFLWFILLYSVYRFSVEFIRDDTPLYWTSESFPGLRYGQIVAIGTFLLAGALLLLLRNRPPATPPPGAPPPPGPMDGGAAPPPSSGKPDATP